MNNRSAEILGQTVDILKRHLNPSRVILFGSRAAGGKNGHADFDLAINVKRPDFSKRRDINGEIEKISGLYKIDIIYMPAVTVADNLKKIQS